MSKRDRMPSADEPKRAEDAKPMHRVVDLARRELRQRGLTEEQIDVLLKRTKAPDHLS